MADKTKIEWADATWNPVTGCTRVSPGCENCYIDWAPPFRIEGRHFTEACPECSGLGLAAIAYAGRVEVAPPCPACQGTGRVRSHAIGSTTGVRLHPERDARSPTGNGGHGRSPSASPGRGMRRSRRRSFASSAATTPTPSAGAGRRRA